MHVVAIGCARRTASSARWGTALAVAVASLWLVSAVGAADGDSGAEGGRAQRGLLNRWLPSVAAAQRDLHRVLARDLRDLDRTRWPGGVIALAMVAFAYGIVHGAGPGHGKIVVACLFFTRRTGLRGAILAGLAISLLQVASAIAIVWLFAVVLRHAGTDVARRAAWVELTSYGLVAIVGLAMTARAVVGGGAHAGRGLVAALIAAIGLLPCAAAVSLGLIAAGGGAVAVRMVPILAMALGMGATMATIAVAGAAARRLALATAGVRPGLARWTDRALAVLGPLAIAVGGCVFLAGAVANLR